ncbi:homeobox domain protein [Ceratobasidium sp. AG-Ba]|nr:homeobox domain protein [Ceratobasidium sp. AG-Ba]
MAWSCPMDAQNTDAPRRSRRTASAQLVVSTDHTHSTDITIEVPDEDKLAPPPEPTHPQLPTELESPLSPPSAESTPSQSATFSAVPPPRTRSATIASPLRGPLDSISDEQKPSSIGPQRVRSATLSSPSTSTAAGLPGSSRANIQKRKRSRVTPEQLAHLERVFSQDRSPTAARRKEISEQLGMQERQTQIWFQNRRAKAKLVESKGRSGRPGSPGSGRDTPPDTPPELSPGYEADLQALLHETEPISIIPCTDLTIGSWHRIADRTGRHDLVAYISDHKASLTWFIHSGGHGFKMEIPISTVLNADFSHSSHSHPGQGIASFYLSEKPIFYMEDANTGSWQVCDDWTEGRQASHILKHQLVGSAVQLSHAIRVFEARRQNPGMLMGRGMGPGMAQMGYPNVEAPRPVSMQIPQPPLLGVQQPQGQHQLPQSATPPMFTFPPNNAARAFHATHGRKRSYSGPPAYHDPPTEGMVQFNTQQQQQVFGPDYAEESRFNSFQLPVMNQMPTPAHNHTHAGPSHAHGHQHQNSMTDFTSIPIAHSLSRPFSAGQQDTSPQRPYVERRATFDVHAHGTPDQQQQQAQLVPDVHRRYSEMVPADFGYGNDVFSSVGGGMVPGSSPMFNMGMGLNYSQIEEQGVSDVLQPPTTHSPGSM